MSLFLSQQTKSWTFEVGNWGTQKFSPLSHPGAAGKVLIEELLGSEKFGTCQAKRMCYPYLQPSKKRHQQRNVQFREGAFHPYRSLLSLLQLDAQARQCPLVPALICTSWHTRKRLPKSDNNHNPSSSLSSFVLHCHPLFFVSWAHPSHRSGTVPVTAWHVLCWLFSFPHLSTFFPSTPLTPQSHAQHLKSWHRAAHARGHCHNLTGQMTELGSLAQPCLSLLMRLNQTCMSLGFFASLFPFPSGILTNPSIPLLPTSSNCSRDFEIRTDDTTAQPFCLVTHMHY